MPVTHYRSKSYQTLYELKKKTITSQNSYLPDTHEHYRHRFLVDIIALVIHASIRRTEKWDDIEVLGS